MTARGVLEAATRALKARQDYDDKMERSTNPEAGYFLSEERNQAEELEGAFGAALDAYVDQRIAAWHNSLERLK